MALVGLLLLTSACDNIGCSTKRTNYASDRKTYDFGSINFRDSKDSKPFYSVSARKLRGGYALQAPVYEGKEEGVNAKFTIQRDKEYSGFTGMLVSYAF